MQKLSLILTPQDKVFDIEISGGKAFNLLKMAAFNEIKVPPFFVISSYLYKKLLFCKEGKSVNKLISELSNVNLPTIQKNTQKIRSFFSQSKLPTNFQKEIIAHYKKLDSQKNLPVAVRSSATCEDLPEASFAGQQETYLNVRGEKAVLKAVKKCLASLFTVRATVYRNKHKIPHEKAALSIVVQKMINPLVSGVVFSVDPVTGFEKVVRIDASFGLGEAIVQGIVTPDTFLVSKKGFILKKEFGQKDKMIVYSQNGGTKLVKVPQKMADSWSLDNKSVLELAEKVKLIDNYYSSFMDVEFAFDSQDKLWILQARPETKWQILRIKNPNLIPFGRARIIKKEKVSPYIRGLSASPGAACGKALFLEKSDPLTRLKPGNILMAQRTDPDMVPAMQVAAGVITAIGGRTSHAAIVSRELGIPAVVGTESLEKLKSLDGKMVTLDGDEGVVFDKELKLKKESADIDVSKLPKTKTRVGLILADVNQAFRLSKLAKNDFEVGLLRAEFMLGQIAVHPQALDEYDKGLLKKRSKELHQKVKELLTQRGFRKGKDYFIKNLAWGLACFAQAFSPRPVIYRTTDFKTNEYKNQLIGGELYEPNEDNPMLGNRGTGRYLMAGNLEYLSWELEALIYARKNLNSGNLELMLPFVRTLTEAKRALRFTKKKLKGEKLKIIAMSEIPSNALIAPEFARLFDGFSIGSNDMTQLVLGTDRDNQTLQTTYDEQDPAVVKAILATIFTGLRFGKKVGFCGQGVSDSPIIAGLVCVAGITSASVVPDRYLQTKNLLASLEKEKVKLKGLGSWLKKQFRKKLTEKLRSLGESFSSPDYNDEKLAFWWEKNIDGFPEKEVLNLEKIIIYATLDWNEIVFSALQLAGFQSFEEAQKLIDKKRG